MKSGGGLDGGASGGLPGFQGTLLRWYLFTCSLYPEKKRLSMPCTTGNPV